MNAVATAAEIKLADAIVAVLAHSANHWTEVTVKRTFKPDYAFRVVRDSEGLRVEWPVTPDASDSGERITHGRHCTCSACEREDWTRPECSPCGMHGDDCPRRYAPLGAAGEMTGGDPS